MDKSLYEMAFGGDAPRASGRDKHGEFYLPTIYVIDYIVR